MTTALLFITPAALVQLTVAPLIGRLAVRIGWVTVLRAGLVSAVAVTALLAVFALDRNMAILLTLLFGASMGVALTPLAALGVIQAPEDEPGSLPGISNAAFGIGGSLGFAWAGRLSGRAQSLLPLGVVDLRRHRYRGYCDQPDPQAESAPVVSGH